MPPLLSDLLFMLLGAAVTLGVVRLARARATPSSAAPPADKLVHEVHSAHETQAAPAEPIETDASNTSTDAVPPGDSDACLPLFLSLPEAALILDSAGHVLQANPAALALFNEPEAAVLARRLPVPAAASTPEAPVGASASEELQLPRPGQTVLAVEIARSPILWQSQPRWLATLRPLDELRRLRHHLAQADARHLALVEHASEWKLWLAPDGAPLYCSPACLAITGYPPQHFLDDPLIIQSLVDEADLESWKDFMHTSVHAARPSSPSANAATDHRQLDFRIRHKSGRSVWISQSMHVVFSPQGQALGLVASAQDISLRKHTELELRRQTLHDQLTGLPNRALFLDRLDQARMRATRRSDYFFALCFLDLDRFKTINDSLGHTAGDKVLVEVTRRILDSVRTLDTVSRFGGDEYAILLEELASPRGAVQIVKRIRQLIGEPLAVDDTEIRITASMGVVLSPMDNLPAELLLRNANIALHAAKEQGRDCFKVFTNKMLDQAVLLMTMEQEMRRGVQSDEFFLVFQPFVDLQSNQLVGFEALVRWRHPTRGLMPPGAFIALAEETGAIIDLGSLVLQKACAAWVAWAEQWPAVRNTLMSVNISGRQFSQFGFLDSIRAVLDKTGMPPERLKLEITETAIMEDAQSSAEKLNRIKEMGIALSIDDFGTGYSSMSYLQRFPLDNLKIDLSFIRLMHVSQENMEIVKAIINLAHTLGMEVVAEGVEDDVQRATLQGLHCEYAQGYYFARPMPDAEMREFLASLDQDAPVVTPRPASF